jgi:hypothetical protein
VIMLAFASFFLGASGLTLLIGVSWYPEQLADSLLFKYRATFFDTLMCCWSWVVVLAFTASLATVIVKLLMMKGTP